MRNTFAFFLIAAAAAIPAFPAVFFAPEIDPGSGAAALAMLSGAVLVLRSRRRR